MDSCPKTRVRHHRKRVRRSSVSMDQVPQVQYPHPQQQQASQQTTNGSMMRPGPGSVPSGPMNLPPHGPPGMTNPGIGMPMGPQIPGNTTSPGMGGPRAPNVMQMQYDQGVHAVTKYLAMLNLPGDGAGTPPPGEPPFNQGPGPGQTQFPGSQNNQLGQNKPMEVMPPPSPAGGPPKEQPKDVKPPGPNAAPHRVRVLRKRTKVDIKRRRKTKKKPAVVGVDVPGNFLTAEFMESVARTLDDFDTQTLFRSEDAGINFEEFREWFNPDDLT